MINRIDDMYELTDGYQFMGSVKLQDCEGELYFCVGDALECGYYELLIETDKYTLMYTMGFDDEEKAQIDFDLDIEFIECMPSVDELIEYGFKCTFNYGEPITDNNNGF